MNTDPGASPDAQPESNGKIGELVAAANLIKQSAEEYKLQYTEQLDHLTKSEDLLLKQLEDKYKKLGYELKANNLMEEARKPKFSYAGLQSAFLKYDEKISNLSLSLDAISSDIKEFEDWMRSRDVSIEFSMACFHQTKEYSLRYDDYIDPPIRDYEGDEYTEGNFKLEYTVYLDWTRDPSSKLMRLMLRMQSDKVFEFHKKLHDEYPDWNPTEKLWSSLKPLIETKSHQRIHMIRYLPRFIEELVDSRAPIPNPKDDDLPF